MDKGMSAEKRERLFEWASDWVKEEKKIEILFGKSPVNGIAQRLADSTGNLLKANRREALQEAADKLHKDWNCNCLTDPDLHRNKCECIGNPAHIIEKLIEEA